jgi:hypothetical protein
LTPNTARVRLPISVQNRFRKGSGIREVTAIRFITISQAARRLGKNPDFTRGAVCTAGIQLTRVGRALLMTPEDFERLRAAVENSPEPVEASSDVCSSVQ